MMMMISIVVSNMIDVNNIRKEIPMKKISTSIVACSIEYTIEIDGNIEQQSTPIELTR
jgi:hypothetical protein